MSTVLRPMDIQDEVREYTMPEVYRGMPVIWYRNGSVHNLKDMTVGFIIKFTPAHVTLLLPEFRVSRRDAVPHISDPRLKLGVDHRENGAWDYTEFHKEMKKAAAVAGDFAEIAEQYAQLKGAYDTLLGRLEAAESELGSLRADVNATASKRSK